jgi:hypothetical protein
MLTMFHTGFQPPRNLCSVPAYVQFQKTPSAWRVILIEDVEKPCAPLASLPSPEGAVELVTRRENVREAAGAVIVILHFAAQFIVEAAIHATKGVRDRRFEYAKPLFSKKMR